MDRKQLAPILVELDDARDHLNGLLAVLRDLRRALVESVDNPPGPSA